MEMKPAGLSTKKSLEEMGDSIDGCVRVYFFPEAYLPETRWQRYIHIYKVELVSTPKTFGGIKGREKKTLFAMGIVVGPFSSDVCVCAQSTEMRVRLLEQQQQQ